MIGTEIPYKYTALNVLARNNYVAALIMANNEVNRQLDKDRKDCSTQEFKTAIDSLDKILQLLVRRVKKAQSDYEKQQT